MVLLSSKDESPKVHTGPGIHSPGDLEQMSLLFLSPVSSLEWEHQK